jgi:hypothetical protein
VERKGQTRLTFAQEIVIAMYCFAKCVAIITVILFASMVWAQVTPKNYPWQAKVTSCTPDMTFCWYGSDLVTNPEVTAFGNRWVSQDKDEKPFEWITEVRCVKALHVCILARNEKLLFSDKTLTSIDLYFVQEWTESEIRAVKESDSPHGKECEIDTLLLNREDASVTILSVPGPAATTKTCEGSMKPKTVMYRLRLALSKPHIATP